MYRQLDPEKIVSTALALRDRIQERFPNSGLSKLAGEVLQVAQETVARIAWIKKPFLFIKTAVWLLLASIVAIFLSTAAHLQVPRLEDWANVIQVLEAALSAMFFIGAAVLFLTTWDSRIKRHRALKAVNELRAMAHIVDMHQITKDIDRFIFGGSAVPAQARNLTPFELNRYLDYCSELLSLISKITALYAQAFDDAAVLEAVTDLESLSAELSQKIWQKITILDNIETLEKRRAVDDL